MPDLEQDDGLAVVEDQKPFFLDELDTISVGKPKKGGSKLKADPDFDKMAEKANDTMKADLLDFLDSTTELQLSIDELKKDQKDLITVMKSKGYSPKGLRKMVTLMKMDFADRKIERETVDLYLSAIGE